MGAKKEVRTEKKVAKKKPNWIKIRTEYETTDISYRDLSTKHGVSFKTLQPRATREGWNKSKEETKVKIKEKTGQKAIEKISDRNLYDMAVELEATNLINKLILDTLKDAKQFNRHLVTMKKSESTIGCGSESKQWVEEKEFDVVDTRRLEAAARTLETASKLKRLLSNIIDTDKQAKLDIDNKKLDIDREMLDIAKQKAGYGDDEDGPQQGIMLMPSVDMATYEAEKAAELERLIKEKEEKEKEGDAK